jgi:hypothetical protein
LAECARIVNRNHRRGHQQPCPIYAEELIMLGGKRGGDSATKLVNLPLHLNFCATQ